MSAFQDLKGKKYGRWTVLRFSHRDSNSWWVCQCSCGSPEKLVRAFTLKNGSSTSCGCYRADRLRVISFRHGDYVGGKPSTEWHSWSSMWQRCTNPKATGYKRYGGRGITVCERWKEYENFILDMGRKPGPGFSLERKDNDGPYCKDNCVWATKKAQSGNTKSNVMITYAGRTQCMKAWARELGLKYRRVHHCITYLGWSVEKTFTHPSVGA